MDGSIGVIDDLRSTVARLEHGPENAREHGGLPFGVAVIDNALPKGGLALGALHEVSSAGPQGEYATAATLFIAGILARLSGQVLWVTERNDLYPPALAAVGLPPARVIFVDAAKNEILQVAEDAVRARCFVGVTAEIAGTLVMTATRRLQLAAEQSRTTVLLLRRSRKKGNPTLAPSAAVSRWRVVALPSPVPLPHSPETPGFARACWRVDLLRCRGANSASWDVEGCDHAGRMAPLRIPSLLRAAS